MKKLLKYLGFSLLGVIVVGLTTFYIRYSLKSSDYLALAGPEAPNIVVNNKVFRDLNKNGEIDIYEDPSADIDKRIEDLLSRMTIAEKAGMMFVGPIAVGNDGDLQEIPSPTNLPSLIVLQETFPFPVQTQQHFFSCNYLKIFFFSMHCVFLQVL